MKIAIRILAMLGLFAAMTWIAAEAEGGRFGGGGGFRGGGGSFHGGGFAGGARPSMPISRPVPASRPQIQRPAIQSGAAHGPIGGNFANVQRNVPSTRPGAGGAGERHVWEGPRGGTVIGGGGQKSFTGPGGNSISGGGGRYIYTGPHGAVAVGGGKGGSITTAGGKSISGGEAGHVVIGPNGNINAGGTKGAIAKGPNGAAQKDQTVPPLLEVTER